MSDYDFIKKTPDYNAAVEMLLEKYDAESEFLQWVPRRSQIVGYFFAVIRRLVVAGELAGGACLEAEYVQEIARKFLEETEVGPRASAIVMNAVLDFYFKEKPDNGRAIN